MSKVLSLVAYIPDTRVITYYQYLYVAIDFDGQGSIATSKNGTTYLLLLATISIIKCYASELFWK